MPHQYLVRRSRPICEANAWFYANGTTSWEAPSAATGVLGKGISGSPIILDGFFRH